MAPSLHAEEKTDVMVFKANKPYVSPFDKPQGITESPSLPPSVGSPAPMVDWSSPTPMPVQEVNSPGQDKLRHPTILPPPTNTAVATKSQKSETTKPTPKKENTLKTETRKTDPRKVESPRNETSKRNESPSPKILAKEESLVPPIASEKPTSNLAPPPAVPVLNVAEGGLTSFKSPSKENARPVEPVRVESTQNIDDKRISVPMVSTIVEKMEPAPSSTTPFMPWYIKSIALFIIGALGLLATWKWLLHQAVYGDPAYRDPWFSPNKTSDLKL